MSKKHSILIIEDDADTRLLYKDTFEQSGFEVTTAIDGKDGLEKVQTSAFDIILLDIMMTNLDGLGFLVELKKIKPAGGAKVPILISTNLANDKVLNQAIQLGASDYLIKSDHGPEKVAERAKSLLAKET